MAIDFDRGFHLLRKGAEVVGLMTAAGGFYLAAGLPIPATKQYVDEKFVVVRRSLVGVERRLVRADRNDLRREQGQIIRRLEDHVGDEVAKATDRRRLGEIEDQLKDLDQDDDQLRKQAQELK